MKGREKKSDFAEKLPAGTTLQRVMTCTIYLCAMTIKK